MIDTALNAFEVFRTPRIVLRNTLVIEKPKLELSTIVEHVDVSSEKPIDELVVGEEQVAFGD
jgi:hypothetical protein